MQTRTFGESQRMQNLLPIKKTKSKRNGTVIDRHRKKMEVVECLFQPWQRD